MKNLSRIVRDADQRRKRCISAVEVLSEINREVVTSCNICGEKNILIVSNLDRYGFPLRAGMCTNCGLIFLIDRLTADGYAEFYKNHYRSLVSAYLGRLQNAATIQAEQKQYAQTLLALFKGLMPLKPGDKLLDVGGSTGVIASEFANAYGLSATVLDPSPDELEVAKSAGHKTICALFESWSGNSDPFDVVVCCRTIDHFLDLKDSLSKLLSLCKPSGYVLIDIIDVEAVRRRAMLEGAIKVDHCYYLCAEVAPAILASAGFQVLGAELVSHLDRVTYLCCPSSMPAVEIASPQVWLMQRVRDIQQARLDQLEAKRQPYSTWDMLHRQAYRLKRKLIGGA
ncbi:MAG: class I SAM-dependent methyltransferase [Chloroflexota bacterium]